MTDEEVMARSGRTFSLASRLLAADMRRDAAALYAYCRRVDDLADEGAETGALQEALEALKLDPLGESAAAAGWPINLEERYPGIARIAVTLTEALAADTGSRRIATEPELLQYAFGVAGTVGLMMCRILGAPPDGAEAASHLGIAMQLSNIARDVAEDWARDRVYLPGEWVSPEAVVVALNGGEPGPLVAATKRLLALADRYYVSADRGMGYLPWRARAGILAAASCYREIGVQVGRDVPASWRQRTVVSPGRKAVLVAGALARLRRPGFRAGARLRAPSVGARS